MSARPEGQADGLLDGGVAATGAVELQRFEQAQWRLCHEFGIGSAMRLGGVDQERVAEIDRAGGARCDGFGKMRRRGLAVAAEFAERQPRFACGRQLAGDVVV